MLKVKYYLYTNITCSGSQSEVPKTFSKGPEELSFPTTYVRPDFLHVLQPKQHNCNRSNEDANMKIQFSSIKPDIKELCKNVKLCPSSHNFFLGGKYRYFSLKMFLCHTEVNYHYI